MRKKNLKVQVAALAVTGVIAATPLSVRAGETGNPAASTEEAPSTAIAAASATSQEQLQRQQAGATTTSGTTEAPATTAPDTGAPAPAATTPAAVSSDVIKNADGSISFKEPAVDSGTTAPNNVENVVKDDKQGTDISASFWFWGGDGESYP